MITLLCVSKALNALVTPLLFAHLRIERPSALLGVYRAILRQPSRGKMVKSLHLGPVTDSSSLFWPLRYSPCGKDEDGENDYQLFIQPAEHAPWTFVEEMLPKWYPSVELFSLDAPEPDCHGMAVFDALEVAMQALDVEPYRKEYGKSGLRIGLVSVRYLRPLLEPG